ncbi:MAG: DEAD/DEAH box helicase [Bacteroidaceae bacterium]|nr:DEAD/DEAH box helicase [Bacteroidaceae bacterium]
MNYNLSKLGITELNVMQEEMLVQSRRGEDVLLLSPTGSGKTLAYLLPLIEEIPEACDETVALVLVPSRELAIQTHETVTRVGCGVRAVACYGGRAAMDEHRTLRGVRPHVIIGTPGRILDHLGKGNFSPESVRTLVIDEFDKSLELGFQPQMQGIIDLLPHVRRRVLLSATAGMEPPSFVGMRQTLRMDYLDGSQLSDGVTLRQLRSPERDKLTALLRLLCHLGDSRVLVFVGYRESVERVADFLRRADVSVSMLHGGMEQRDRERSIARFSNGSSNVLVSTDLASRGLDITDLDCVIHYHLPATEDVFTHRGGRTARWDRVGEAVMLLGPEETMPPFVRVDAGEIHLPQRLPAPARPRWTTIYIGRGKRDKVSRGDVMGFLCKTGGLSREEVGRIDVMADWCYAAVSSTRADALLAALKGQKIKGQKTIFAIAR